VSAEGVSAREGGELASMLREIPMRVGAELGRARMPLAHAVDLGPGIVIELDRDADDPIELTVNGEPFATGQLLLIDGNEWAIRIERLVGRPQLGRELS